MRDFLLVLGLLLAFGGRTFGEPPTPADIPALLRQMDSPKFAEREAASKALEALGEPALNALWKAAVNHANSIEARTRIVRVIRAIEKNLQAPDFEKLRGTWRVAEVTEDGHKLPEQLYIGRVHFFWNWDHLKEASPILREVVRLDPAYAFPPNPADAMPATHLVFWDFRWTRSQVKGGFDDIIKRQGTIEVGRDAGAKSIDLEFTRPYVDGKKHIAGIYRLDGDRLVLCLEMQGGPRPKQFETREAPSRLMLVFQREQKTKSPP